MSRALRLAALLAIAALGLGCAAIPGHRSTVVPPTGFVYSRYKAPLSVSGPVEVGDRRGRATVHQIGLPPNPWTGWQGYPLVSWGDASVRRAAENGGITEVSRADYDFLLVMLVYRRYTTEVYGK